MSTYTWAALKHVLYYGFTLIQGDCSNKLFGFQKLAMSFDFLQEGNWRRDFNF
jgi:hypothetical protein